LSQRASLGEVPGRTSGCALVLASLTIQTLALVVTAVVPCGPSWVEGALVQTALGVAGVWYSIAVGDLATSAIRLLLEVASCGQAAVCHASSATLVESSL